MTGDKMIEIKISDSAALMLLTDRMNYELEMRKSAKILPENINLNELNFSNLLDISETAVADLVMTIPADILLSKNNLGIIITGAINSLHTIYGFDEFKDYSIILTNRLLRRIVEHFKNCNDKNIFKYN
jgi:hypothetical protein